MSLLAVLPVSCVTISHAEGCSVSLSRVACVVSLTVCLLRPCCVCHSLRACCGRRACVTHSVLAAAVLRVTHCVLAVAVLRASLTACLLRPCCLCHSLRACCRRVACVHDLAIASPALVLINDLKESARELHAALHANCTLHCTPIARCTARYCTLHCRCTAR